MKFGKVSWNGSYNHKRGVLTTFVCSSCGRKYKLERTKVNHQRLCTEHFENESNRI